MVKGGGDSKKLTCDTFSVMLFFVTLHTHFMTSNDRFQTVLLAETLRNIRSELHTNTALAGASAGFGLGVGPKHLHHQTSLAGLSLLVAV